MSTSTPSRVEFATREAGAGVDYLGHAYGRMRLEGGGDGFRLRHVRRDAGRFALDDLLLALPANLDVEPKGAFLIGQLTTGRMEVEVGGVAERYGPGDVFLACEPAEAMTIRTGGTDPATLQGRIISLDPSLLAAVTGADGPGRAFAGRRPVSETATMHWRETVRDVAGSVLATPDAAASPLLVGAAAHLLAAAAATAFPCRTTRPDAASGGLPPGSSAAVLRRAVAHIDDHAQTDLSPAGIAAACRVGVGELRTAFARHLETTPTGYLRRVRLDRAHRELVAATPDHPRATIAAVAARWGFPNPVVFANAYHHAYGTPPEATLRS